MLPEKGDVPSSSCFPCFLERVILEDFTVFLKVLFMDQHYKSCLNAGPWALPKTF